jgi:hypothetical protein
VLLLGSAQPDLAVIKGIKTSMLASAPHPIKRIKMIACAKFVI